MIETDITLTVYPHSGYHYKVDASSEEIRVTYIEENMEANIGFGSLEEMEAVAKAMLKVVQLAKN